MEHLRKTKSRAEIVKLLLQYFEKEKNLVLIQKETNQSSWQFICEAVFESLNIYEGVFFIKLKEQGKISFEREVYFLFKDLGFTFKTRLSIIKSPDPDLIGVKIPVDLNVKEFRQSPRLYIPSEKKIFITVQFVSKLNRAKGLYITCPVYNVSETGICLIINKEILSSVILNEELKLEGLFVLGFDENCRKAIIRNARVFKKRDLKNDELYALGIEFL